MLSSQLGSADEGRPLNRAGPGPSIRDSRVSVTAECHECGGYCETARVFPALYHPMHLKGGYYKRLCGSWGTVCSDRNERLSTDGLNVYIYKHVHIYIYIYIFSRMVVCTMHGCRVGAIYQRVLQVKILTFQISPDVLIVRMLLNNWFVTLCPIASMLFSFIRNPLPTTCLCTV